jgi:hypothetical protein
MFEVNCSTAPNLAAFCRASRGANGVWDERAMWDLWPHATNPFAFGITVHIFKEPSDATRYIESNGSIAPSIQGDMVLSALFTDLSGSGKIVSTQSQTLFALRCKPKSGIGGTGAIKSKIDLSKATVIIDKIGNWESIGGS